MFVHAFEYILSCDRAYASQTPVHHASQGIDIGARIHGFAAELLWAHIQRTAEYLAGASQVVGFTVNRREHFGDAEVQNFDKIWLSVKLDQHDVGRFQISVDNAFLVGMTERGTYLQKNSDRPGDRNLPRFLKHAPKIDAFQKVHDQIGLIVR